MRRIDSARRCSFRAFCVSAVCVCLLGTPVSLAKTAEPTEMCLGHSCGPEIQEPYTQGEMTSRSLWPRYDRRFCGYSTT